MANIIARWHKSINEIPEQSWKYLSVDNDNPFYDWKWLNLMETSLSVSAKSGWQPIHLSIWKESQLIGFAPLYLKSHSYGEFIFDQNFANLAAELGKSYYPKIIGMSPFSPVEGYRFLISQNECIKNITKLMLKLIDEFAERYGILSCNFLYVDLEWGQLAEELGCSKWLNQQSIWLRKDAHDFDEFLHGFNSNQRKNIKKERKSIQKDGIYIKPLIGSEITVEIMNKMHDFYEEQCSKWGIWGSKYLSKKFFEDLVIQKHCDQIILFAAFRERISEPLAMSLCVKRKDMLWGRYWGSKEEIKYLHFEVCYYSPIDWALKNKINYFDPGAGGNHKKRRGFNLKPNTSLYRWYDKSLESIIKNWLPLANSMQMQEINASNSKLPFKKVPRNN